MNQKNQKQNPLTCEQQSLLDIQAQRNANFLNQIKQKINLRSYYTQQVANLNNNINQKDILIKSQEQNDFTLNIPSKNVGQIKLMEQYNKNQEYIKKNNVRFENKKVIDFYEKGNNDIISHGSVNTIGMKPRKCLYMNTELYIQCLKEQMREKEKENLRIKEKDKELEKNLVEKNKRDIEDEKEKRNRYYNKLKNDFVRQNRLLIENKSKEKALNKSCDIALEKYNEKKINDELNKEAKEERFKKLRMRRDLDNYLKLHLQHKKQLQDMEDMENKMYSRGKACFEEEHIKDEYGRCIKCNRKFKKKFITSPSEYEKVMKRKI